MCTLIRILGFFAFTLFFLLYSDNVSFYIQYQQFLLTFNVGVLLSGCFLCTLIRKIGLFCILATLFSLYNLLGNTQQFVINIRQEYSYLVAIANFYFQFAFVCTLIRIEFSYAQLIHLVTLYNIHNKVYSSHELRIVTFRNH